ncbi:hypothetical protein ACE6H2_028589 [Prunus campanulata]
MDPPWGRVDGRSLSRAEGMGMAAKAIPTTRSSLKLRPWTRCSKHIREQRARLYIVWRCSVMLMCWHD